jgi:hypothetical protein
VAAYTGSYKNIQLDFSANYLQYDAQGNLLNTTRTTTETHNAPGTGRLKDRGGLHGEADSAAHARRQLCLYQREDSQHVQPLPAGQRGDHHHPDPDLPGLHARACRQRHGGRDSAGRHLGTAPAPRREL